MPFKVTLYFFLGGFIFKEAADFLQVYYIQFLFQVHQLQKKAT